MGCTKHGFGATSGSKASDKKRSVLQVEVFTRGLQGRERVRLCAHTLCDT